MVMIMELSIMCVFVLNIFDYLQIAKIQFTALKNVIKFGGVQFVFHPLKQKKRKLYPTRPNPTQKCSGWVGSGLE